MREWEPSEDEYLGRLVDLEMAKDRIISLKKTMPASQVIQELAAIDSEQELIRRLYHG